MSLQVHNPLPVVSDEDDDIFSTEDDAEGIGVEYNMRELMDQVYALRDLIITIPSDQVSLLKQGLIVRKSKDNQKLKGADISTPSEVLSFLVTPAKGEDGKEKEGFSDVRVKLGPKKSVTVVEIRKPNDEF